MIVCSQCGFGNLDDDTFCGSCGAFLEWTGERTAPPPAATEDEPDAPSKRSLLSRVQTVLSLDVHAPGEVGAEPGDSTGSSSRTPGPPGTSRPPGAGGGPPSRPPAGGPPSRPPGAGGGAGGGPPSRPPGGSGAPAADDPARTETSPSSDTPTTAPSSDPAAAGLVAADATAPASRREPTGEAPTTAGPGTGWAADRATNGPTDTSTGTSTGPVRPTAPITRRPARRSPPSRKLLPGDLVCGDCGEGNPPARNFCRRCGATLADATVVRRRWWQRLVPRRRARTLDAGDRPWKAADGSQRQRRKGGRLGKVYAKIRPIAAAVLLLAGLVVGFSPDLRERVTGRIGEAKDAVVGWVRPTYVPLSPISVSATSQRIEHPVAHVIDGNTLSFWVSPASDREPVLVVRFDEPFDLERIKVWNGSAEGFKDRERARDLHFVFDNGRSFDLELDDLPNGVEYEIEGGDGVREVEIQILDTYRSLTSDDLGLSEIEFYFRR